MHRPRRASSSGGSAVLAAGAVLALAGLVGCQRSAGPGGPAAEGASAVPAITTSSSPPPASPAQACSRLVSALGWVDPLLVPAGAEERQRFDDALRGRIGYVRGVIDEVREALPGDVGTGAARLRRAADSLTPAGNRHDDQVRVLREFRAAAGDVVRRCSAAR